MSYFHRFDEVANIHMGAKGLGALFNRQDVNMTEGPILGHIIRFSIPLLLGNLFQQLYNAVDTWVVGNYVSNEAFSAVGSTGQIFNMLIGFFLGLSTGAEVIIARNYGVGDKEKLSKSIHTTLVMNLWVSIVLTVVSILIIPFVLGLMNTPPEVYPEAKLYLTVYFGGIIGLTTYNIGSGILRAVGDSYHPFCYLVVAASINIFLDFFLVIVMRAGVAGVAMATVISQGISAILILIRLFKSESPIRVSFNNLQLNSEIQRKMFSIGVPAGLQTSITGLSNIFLYSYIYYFGVDCMSGWASYDKLINFMHLPMLSISMAVTTFVSQNYGAGKIKRARKGLKHAMTLGIIISLIYIFVYEVFTTELIGIFNHKAEVVEYGVIFMKYVAPSYLFSGTAFVLSAATRGLGESLKPMLISVSCYVVFRQIFMLIATNLFQHDVMQIITAFDLSWIICTTIQYIVYRYRLKIVSERRTV